jgi:hypothetical protein
MVPMEQRSAADVSDFLVYGRCGWGRPYVQTRFLATEDSSTLTSLVRFSSYNKHTLPNNYVGPAAIDVLEIVGRSPTRIDRLGSASSAHVEGSVARRRAEAHAPPPRHRSPQVLSVQLVVRTRARAARVWSSVQPYLRAHTPPHTAPYVRHAAALAAAAPGCCRSRVSVARCAPSLTPTCAAWTGDPS